MGSLQPKQAVACDTCKPLIEMWNLAKNNPRSLSDNYRKNWEMYQKDRKIAYNTAKERFNTKHNPHDFLFISRSCYGGIIRFRKDGYLSTPLGPHRVISPFEFDSRLSVWNTIVQNTEFICADFSEILSEAGKNDLVYCDPPYKASQKIIYGAQEFDMKRLYENISEIKSRGAFIALSVDGTKKSGRDRVEIFPPDGLFELEYYISLRGSMLKRFWRGGGNVLDEHVKDRLLISSSRSVPIGDLIDYNTKKKIFKRKHKERPALEIVSGQSLAVRVSKREGISVIALENWRKQLATTDFAHN